MEAMSRMKRFCSRSSSAGRWYEFRHFSVLPFFLISKYSPLGENSRNTHNAMSRQLGQDEFRRFNCFWAQAASMASCSGSVFDCSTGCCYRSYNVGGMSVIEFCSLGRGYGVLSVAEYLVV